MRQEIQIVQVASTRRLQPWWPGALLAVTPAFVPFLVDSGDRSALRWVILAAWVVVGSVLTGVAVRAARGRGVRPHGRIVAAAALGASTCGMEPFGVLIPGEMRWLTAGLVFVTVVAFIHLHAYRDTVDFVGLQRDVPPSLTGLTLLLILLGPVVWVVLGESDHGGGEPVLGNVDASASHGLPSLP